MPAEFESGLFVKVPAWHHEGIVLEEAPNIDKALEISCMDWEVKKVPLFANEDGIHIKTDHFAITRRTSEGPKVLGVVGDRYELFQNREAFEYIRPLVESNLWKIETCGVLCGGKKEWILLKQDSIEIVPNDVLKEYLLFTWGHDGFSPAVFQPTMIRVVCNNTLQASLSQGNQIRVLHSAMMRNKLDFVKDILSSSQDSFETEITMFKQLLDKKFTFSLMEEMIEKLYGGKHSQNKMMFVKDFVLNQKASGMKKLGVAETGYGFFNALSEVNEHYLISKRSEVGQSVLFGSVLKKNQEVLSAILAA